MRWKKESADDIGNGLDGLRTITICAFLTEKASTAYCNEKHETAFLEQNNRANDYIVRIDKPWWFGSIRFTHTSTIALVAVK